MTTIANIYLEAINPDRNCRRAYRITLSNDLFGTFLVETRHGRIGIYGRNIVNSFHERAQALAFVATALKHRAQAKRRLQTDYVVVEAFGMHEVGVDDKWSMVPLRT